MIQNKSAQLCVFFNEIWFVGNLAKMSVKIFSIHPWSQHVLAIGHALAIIVSGNGLRWFSQNYLNYSSQAVNDCNAFSGYSQRGTAGCCSELAAFRGRHHRHAQFRRVLAASSTRRSVRHRRGGHLWQTSNFHFSARILTDPDLMQEQRSYILNIYLFPVPQCTQPGHLSRKTLDGRTGSVHARGRHDQRVSRLQNMFT